MKAGCAFTLSKVGEHNDIDLSKEDDSRICIKRPGAYKVTFRVVPSNNCDDKKPKSGNKKGRNIVGLELDKHSIKDSFASPNDNDATITATTIIKVKFANSVLRLKNFGCNTIDLNELEECVPNVAISIDLI